MKKRLWTYTSFSADLGYVFHVIFILYNCFIVLLQKGSSQGQTREGYSGCYLPPPEIICGFLISLVLSKII